jgi:Protein of unknown function (DUF3775)
MAQSEDMPPPELNISTEKVCYIIVKAREFDAKVPPVEPDPGSNPADDGEREILEDYADDPTLLELRSAIDDLNEDEVVDLIALAWLGRGDFGKEDWLEATALARERHKRHSADYLIGIPTLGDFLEDGLDMVGRSCEDFEIGRL